MQKIENCCNSQSTNPNNKPEKNKEDKTVCLTTKTKTQKQDINKRTFKDYCGFIIIVFIGILYMYYIIKYNLISWCINTAISQGGSFLRFLIKFKTRISSFNKYSKIVEGTITSVSSILKERVCRWPVEFVSESITFGLNCCVINNAILLFLFLSNVASLSYLGFTVTAFASLFM